MTFASVPDYVLHASAFLAVHLGSLAVIAASAWAFGDTVLSKTVFRKTVLSKTVLRPMQADEKDLGRWALSSALGLGLIAQAMFVLGLLGLFQRWIVLGLIAVAHLLCRHTWRSTFGALRKAWEERQIGVSHIVLSLAGAAPFIVMALYPPTGWDATVYHLPYVESFVESGRLTFVPEFRYPVFPQVAEMGFLVGFFLSGAGAAKLTQTLSIFLTAALVFSWGRRYFSSRTGLWASALWLGTPLVLWFGSLAYVDVELTLFVTAALYSWERWHESSDGRWLGLAGVFAGLAAGTKYLGLFFCGALFVLTAAPALKKRTVRPLVTLAVATAIFMGPWYLRNLYYTGNPVFPFYAPIFGESEWTSRHDQEVFGRESKSEADDVAAGVSSVIAHQASRIAEGLGVLVLLPWNGVFHRELFHHHAPLTPFYILLIPLCVPFALAAPRPRRLLGLTGVYALFWLAIEHDLRFLLPVFPALNLALASGLRRWTRSLTSRMFVAATALLLLGPSFFYAGFKIRERGVLPVTASARQDYLSREIPGYDAIRLLNEREGSSYTVYGLFASRLCFYADGRLLGDWFGPMRYNRILRVLKDSRRLDRELREIGAGFFLVQTRHRRSKLPRDAFFEQRFSLVWQDSDYALYELRE